ncbi:radical SAM protein [Clostridioides difficile]|uniref:radical SAM/SPASM domain-containing protein n=1 Tax=Clostridioides difficile TaxID=1496 RepID=UPI0020C3C85B|nr:radical SAM protein [Clostridioides difficile]
MHYNKYFIKDIAQISEEKHIAYIGNKMTGDWIKIPKICMDTINYSYENKILVGDTIKFYEDEDDKIYYKKILKNLDNMDLLSTCYIEKAVLNRLEKVTFALTEQCNLKCNFCSMDSHIDKNEEIDYDTVIRIIRNIMKLKPKKLILTGGEPLMRRDFLDILKYIKDNYDTKVQLMTNATLIDESIVDKLTSNLYAIDISIDGYDKESCDSVRGKGTFDKINHNIDLLKKKKFRNISLSMVLGEHNYSTVDKFNKFCEDKELKAVSRYFIRMGRGEYNKVYLSNEKDIMFIPNIDYKPYLRCHTCKPGITQIYIDYKGDVYPCSLLRDSKYKMIDAIKIDSSFVSNIFNKELKVYKEIEKLSTLNYFKCKDCKNKFFCNNCLSIMDTLVNDDDLFTHNCNKIKEIINI